ncbi:uncharacterized protein HMPREF1541_10129 [Cyphellophora europaea CBS 101466]|uniref:Uncharacterized protein n=1 Tax=Cyphellophora europaea (strain CBS 101466) TaxID=1220924 RepID=W2S9A5_CYPE1|nr:uncharacterized protein HMPREF1541_10129 [Cyphellophora europaea CBS 101466]ETN45252.1 hypothetical protein HMPREF1541_10129 [Cyphellophora europaea CBS 101466]
MRPPATYGASAEDIWFVAFKQESHQTYRNRHGEEIAFSPCDPPPGYVFVPSGNTFITRSCRKLAQKLFAVYRPMNRKRPATQIGLHVPRDVFKKVESDFKAKRAKIDESLWRTLDKSYPQIPSADKNELHRLISSRYPSLTGKSALDHSGIIIYAYVRDRYTPFKSLGLYGESRDSEAITEAHQRAQEIIASWRGEDASHDATVRQKAHLRIHGSNISQQSLFQAEPRVAADDGVADVKHATEGRRE